METIGQGHKALRLTISFWLCHAEIVVQAVVGIGPFFVTNNDAAAASEACDAAFDGLIVREGAIAREWRVFRKQGSDVILIVRALRVPRDKDFLPG